MTAPATTAAMQRLLVAAKSAIRGHDELLGSPCLCNQCQGFRGFIDYAKQWRAQE